MLSKTALIIAALAPMMMTTTDGAAVEDLTDVEEIVQRANLAAYYPGDDGRARARMTITDRGGQERVRYFTVLRRNETKGGDQDYVVLFSRPPDVRNTVFLVKKHVGKDDDRWLYLPDLDLVKRIAAGDKRTSFVGSHFLYEDGSGRGTEEDEHQLIETTEDFYIVKNTPKDKGSVEFSHWTVAIDKETFIPSKMEYVDETGEIYRRIEALEVSEIGGHPTVTKMKASDLRTGGHTVVEFRDVQYDLGIPESVFTERTLRNPPRKWFSTR
jgi:outer membrane lipoprotein-sorting protein